MRPLKLLISLLLGITSLQAAPRFEVAQPSFNGVYALNGAKLCATAKETLAYLNKGKSYDPQVIHASKKLPITLNQVKATLHFICQHQQELNSPQFIRQHFVFIRWYPDVEQAKQLAAKKPLLQHLPKDRLLMTKYYVHLASSSLQKQSHQLYPLYALPKDEQLLTLEQAALQPQLTRFQYGKQAILRGALDNKEVPILGYFTRDDLEAALLQGTVVAQFNNQQQKIFNVHRTNNIPYDRAKSPYQQERYWYFKEVDGIKGYGKDADHKITVSPEVTFAGDLKQLGLGKLLLIQYLDAAGTMQSRAGILADTGGAFEHNLYQIDFLAGSYPGRQAFNQATRHLPDYVAAYFMILKER